VSEIDPADVMAGGNPEIPEEFTDDLDIGSTGASLRKPTREGLPSGYKMRADAHYVEQLSSRRAEKALADAPRPAARATETTPPDSPTELRERRDARERRSERALAQLSEDLASIESAVAVVAGEGSPMARRANLDVIVAQAWRASWMLRAMSILDNTHRSHARPRQLGFVLGEVCDRLAAESRLTRFTLHVHASDWNAAVVVDDQALVAALTGAIFGTLGVIGRTDGVAVRLSATASGGELRTVEVSQDEVMVAPTVASRFFDPLWADRPGGWVAGLGASAARAVAQQQGGTAVFLAGDRRGTTLRLTFFPSA
jgi:hypothetical protein